MSKQPKIQNRTEMEPKVNQNQAESEESIDLLEVTSAYFWGSCKFLAFCYGGGAGGAPQNDFCPPNIFEKTIERT